MQEQWIKWEPISNLTTKYDIESCYDDDDGLRIVLECNRKKVKVLFKNGAASYIRTTETLRYNLIGDLGEKYGKDFYGDWTFFKVENSEYLKWLEIQSCTISQGYQLQHFSFIAGDSILDIAASREPIVEHIE